jgi:hypothetical protein
VNQRSQDTLDALSITIRRLGAADADALAGLAQVDSAHAPAAPALGAEADGRLVAAISVESGEVVADPFQPSAEAIALLRLRAGQLRPSRKRRRRRARGALPGSPPGAGGKLLRLLEFPS